MYIHPQFKIKYIPKYENWLLTEQKGDRICFSVDIHKVGKEGLDSLAIQIIDLNSQVES